MKAMGSSSCTLPAGAKQRRQLVDAKGRKRVVIGAHRSNKGQYKVDLFDLSEDQVSAVEEAIRGVLKL